MAGIYSVDQSGKTLTVAVYDDPTDDTQYRRVHNMESALLEESESLRQRQADIEINVAKCTFQQVESVFGEEVANVVKSDFE